MQVESCERCQCNNKKLQKQAGFLHPIVVEPKIWHQVDMDLIGPLQETPRGNKYIVTLTDYFSKWAERQLCQTNVPWVWQNSFSYSVKVIITIIILLTLGACAVGLRYLLCVCVSVCLCVCMSVTVLAATYLVFKSQMK